MRAKSRRESKGTHLAESSPGSRVPGLMVHVGYAAPRKGVPAPTSFRNWTAAALVGAGRAEPAELSIRVVGAHEGRALNRRYRGKDQATNVLSFPAELPRGVVSPLLGDLAVCASVVAREAAEQRKAVRDHYAHMTVHGVLHLLGYDHLNERDAERMEALETRILAALGIRDPYRIQERRKPRPVGPSGPPAACACTGVRHARPA